MEATEQSLRRHLFGGSKRTAAGTGMRQTEGHKQVFVTLTQQVAPPHPPPAGGGGHRVPTPCRKGVPCTWVSCHLCPRGVMRTVSVGSFSGATRKQGTPQPRWVGLYLHFAFLRIKNHRLSTSHPAKKTHRCVQQKTSASSSPLPACSCSNRCNPAKQPPSGATPEGGNTHTHHPNTLHRVPSANRA